MAKIHKKTRLQARWHTIRKLIQFIYISMWLSLVIHWESIKQKWKLRCQGLANMRANQWKLTDQSQHLNFPNKKDKEIYFNKDFLNSYTTYMSIGVSYYHKLNSTMGWMCNYKMQYQAGNTFQNNYSLQEHLFINGLNLGLLF